MATSANGSLLKSHELRLQRVESQTADLMSITSNSAAKLESIATTLVGIDGKLDQHMDALDKHKLEDAGIALKVHDLEIVVNGNKDTQDKKNANRQYAFWTAIAAIAADIVLKGVEHFHNISALLK
jgi:hypothetical protein